MLQQENYKTMLIERRDDGIAVLTLNRPERLNAKCDRVRLEEATDEHIRPSIAAVETHIRRPAEHVKRGGQIAGDIVGVRRARIAARLKVARTKLGIQIG